MQKFKKLKEASLFKRRVILFAVLFVLAVPMVILIGRGFAGNVTRFNGKSLFDQLEIDEELGESFLQIQEASKEFEELMGQMPDMSTTGTSTEFSTGTSTLFSTGTSTVEVNEQ